jgi:phosphonate transport system ATP-binding protein
MNFKSTLNHAEQIKCALKIENLSKTYPNGKQVFQNISFEIPAGQRVALIGSNGTGKSTLLRSALKLIPAVSEKTILLDRDITKLKGSKLQRMRSKVGFVFQQHNLVPRLSVLSNVVHGALAHEANPRYWFQGFAPSQIREKALLHLEQVGLGDLAGRRASDLSGGQSQRVAIARALMQDPLLMVADEPVASLDPKAGEEVMELFSNLCINKGISFIFVSHNLEHAINYSDRIIGLTKNVEANTSMIGIDSSSAEQSIERLKEIYE